MEKGTIKWFNPESNYGFIQRDNGDADVWVHGDEVEANKFLNKGDNVTFEIKEGEGRPKATKVKIA
ncbi:MAG: cold shock domain-containing protein [Candidatus Hermodarchaeota archaeon]|nr:cold shock domain-containing protein [Candidatus Hermodarchaeota archaeon]